MKLEKYTDLDPSVIYTAGCYLSIADKNKIYYFDSSKKNHLVDTGVSCSPELNQRFGVDAVGYPKVLTDAERLMIAEVIGHLSATNECGKCAKCMKIRLSRERVLSRQVPEDRPVMIGASEIPSVRVTLASFSPFGFFPHQNNTLSGDRSVQEKYLVEESNLDDDMINPSIAMERRF